MNIKSKQEKKSEEQTRLFKKIIKAIAIDKAVTAFGEKDVKWAINKYLVSIRARTRLLKEKAATEARLAEISKQI
jgi:glutathione peroxidase-family protein